MIALIKRPKVSASSPGICRARRMVAATLLKRGARPDASPPVPAWKTWLLTAWVITVGASYVAYMSGFF